MNLPLSNPAKSATHSQGIPLSSQLVFSQQLSSPLSLKLPWGLVGGCLLGLGGNLGGLPALGIELDGGQHLAIAQLPAMGLNTAPMQSPILSPWGAFTQTLGQTSGQSWDQSFSPSQSQDPKQSFTAFLTAISDSFLGRSSPPSPGQNLAFTSQASSSQLSPFDLSQNPLQNLSPELSPGSRENPVLRDEGDENLVIVPMQIGLPWWLYTGGMIFVGVVFLPQLGWVAGLIVVGDREVGIITKKFSARSLTPGHLIALNGEAGLQADTLAPGWHFGFFPWQYSIRKEPVVVIPQGEIGLIVANDGQTIPPDRILGKIVPCDDFQNARKFLTSGGEKGRQLGILTAGVYRINTALFDVITSNNANKHGMKPGQLKVYSIEPDRVGIVTALDGQPIEEGEIAGPVIPGHDNFQKLQTFMNNHGRRGLQEQIILSGSWNLNPWFVQVEPVTMTQIPIGYVGVVMSFVGQSHKDISGDTFTHGNLVSKGDKGVWIEPLYPGRHPLNTQIMKVELVPTTNIVLNFTSRISGEHGYDSKLDALKLLSYDGFTFDLEVFQIIHVAASEAPKVISRLGSMQNLVDQVLRPIVGNYFRNSAQEYTILDFLVARSERQTEAADHVRKALLAYDVQAVDTLIGAIVPPADLMHTLTDRKIAAEQQKTYEVQRLAQTQRQELVRETALADIQNQVVTAEQGVKIAELQATARVKQANGEAESIRVTGQAKADAYLAGVRALGSQGYTALQLMQVIGDRQVRVVPDVAVSSGGNGSGSGLVDALLGMMVMTQTQAHHGSAATPGGGSLPGGDRSGSSSATPALTPNPFSASSSGSASPASPTAGASSPGSSGTVSLGSASPGAAVPGAASPGAAAPGAGKPASGQRRPPASAQGSRSSNPPPPPPPPASDNPFLEDFPEVPDLGDLPNFP